MAEMHAVIKKCICMNRITLILATVLSLAFTQVSAQDYNKGLEAYKAGDYATALKSGNL